MNFKALVQKEGELASMQALQNILLHDFEVLVLKTCSYSVKPRFVTSIEQKRNNMVHAIRYVSVPLCFDNAKRSRENNFREVT